MKINYSIDSNYLVQNFEYRTKLLNRKSDVNIGIGNSNADIVVVQSNNIFEERGPVYGALKKFSLNNLSFRTSCQIISDGRINDNAYVLRELIEIIQPYLVVTCGIDATSMLMGRKIRNFNRHHGRAYESKVISYLCFATIDPEDYGDSDADPKFKSDGKRQWQKILETYKKEKEKVKID